jgi:predicted anti-sigma-YlaC factor YlaD
MKDCTHMELKIMALLDEELDDKERKAIEVHIQDCDNCRSVFTHLKKLKGVTQEMRFKKLPEVFWDEYWGQIYNRLERGISWIFISIGAILILSFAAWQFISRLVADSQMHPVLKVGILILVFGVVILLVSILREKILVRKVDKYRKVER